MHSDSSLTSARRRRGRFFVPAVAAGAALGIALTTGLTLASPTLANAAPLAASAIASATAPEATLRDIRVDAQGSVLTARVALTEAAAVTTEIAASGLDIGLPDTSIDTASLEDAADRLSKVDLVPMLLVPGITADANRVTARVSARISELREHLDAAKAQKAAEEAAAAAAAAAA
ncbi:phospholipase, partial [Microbacterium sp. ZW CA_36]